MLQGHADDALMFLKEKAALKKETSQLSISQLDDRTHLHGQTDGVEKDEGEHQVLKVGGVDHVPHLVLVRVLGDVATQRARLQSVLHTLTLSHTHTDKSGSVDEALIFS